MTQPRELWVTYHGTTESELMVDGFATDITALEMAENLFIRESDAWVVSLIGQLPDWWRLVDLVEVKHLAEPPPLDKLTQLYPGDDGSQRWETASVKERVSLQRGWRVVQTANGGQIRRDARDGRRVLSMPVEELDPLETGEITVQAVRIPRTELIVPERRLILL